MENEFEREIGLISDLQYKRLCNSLIVIFGLGGVGGYAFEMLVRTGISNFIIVDKDKFEITNFNRQLQANYDTINKYKVEVYKERALKINKNVNIISVKECVDKNNIISIFSNINAYNNIDNIYIIDCIDDIDAKIEIIKICDKNNYRLISSMGTANHISTEKIKITDIKNTKYCPLAKKIRKEIKDLNIDALDTLYIDEEPVNIRENNATVNTSTISFVPATCGIKIAEYVIKKLL